MDPSKTIPLVDAEESLSISSEEVDANIITELERDLAEDNTHSPPQKQSPPQKRTKRNLTEDLGAAKDSQLVATHHEGDVTSKGDLESPTMQTPTDSAASGTATLPAQTLLLRYQHCHKNFFLHYP